MLVLNSVCGETFPKLSSTKHASLSALSDLPQCNLQAPVQLLLWNSVLQSNPLQYPRMKRESGFYVTEKHTIVQNIEMK